MKKYSFQVGYQLEPVSENEVVVHIKGRGYNPVTFWNNQEIHDFAGMVAPERISYDYNHADDAVLGYCDNIKVTPEYGLEMDGHIFLNMPGNHGSNAYTILKNGVPMEASITFYEDEVEELQPGVTAEVNGTTIQGPVRIYRRWHLRAVALCRFGVDETTQTAPANFSKSERRNNMGKTRKRSETEEQEKQEIPDNEKQSDDGSGEKKVEEKECSDDLLAKITALEETVAILTEKINASEASMTDPTQTENGSKDDEETGKNEDLSEDEEEESDSEKDEKKEFSARMKAIEKKLGLVLGYCLGTTPVPRREKVKKFSSAFEEAVYLEEKRINR